MNYEDKARALYNDDQSIFMRAGAEKQIRDKINSNLLPWEDEISIENVKEIQKSYQENKYKWDSEKKREEEKISREEQNNAQTEMEWRFFQNEYLKQLGQEQYKRRIIDYVLKEMYLTDICKIVDKDIKSRRKGIIQYLDSLPMPNWVNARFVERIHKELVIIDRYSTYMNELNIPVRDTRKDNVYYDDALTWCLDIYIAREMDKHNFVSTGWRNHDSKNRSYDTVFETMNKYLGHSECWLLGAGGFKEYVYTCRSYSEAEREKAIQKTPWKRDEYYNRLCGFMYLYCKWNHIGNNPEEYFEAEVEDVAEKSGEDWYFVRGQVESALFFMPDYMSKMEYDGLIFATEYWKYYFKKIRNYVLGQIGKLDNIGRRSTYTEKELEETGLFPSLFQFLNDTTQRRRHAFLD